MGNAISRWHDDDDDWQTLKRTADISDVSWDVYSREADHAKYGYEKKLTGGRLKMYVKHALELDKLKERQTKEIEEYEKFLKLKSKYENNI